SENVTKALGAAEFNALSDGTHTVFVRGRDSAGNWGAVASATFVKDTTGPTSSITFPASGGTYNTAGWNAGCATPGLCGTASDASGVASVRVSIHRSSDGAYWDGTGWSLGPENFILATGTTGWNYALPASALTDGLTYTVHARATDTLSTVGNTASNTFTYDTTAPTVTVDQPAGQDDPTNGQPIHFTATFSEPVTGFGDDDVTLGGTANHGSATVHVSGTGPTYDIAVSGLGDGTVTATIGSNKAQDAAGNGNAASTNLDNSVL